MSGVPSNNVSANGVGSILDSQLNTFVQTDQTVAQLRGFQAVTGMAVLLQGTNAPGDGGAGLFYWNTGSFTDDGINTIVPWGAQGAGGWLRAGGIAAGTVTSVVAGNNLVGTPTTITTTGTIALAGTITNVTLAGATTAGSFAIGGPVSLGGTVGTVGQVLSSNSLGAPAWVTNTGSGTVTSVIAGAGLAGGTITGTGTISLGTISATSLFGNPTGSSAVPEAIAIGTNLSLSGTTLNAAGGSGSVTSVTLAGINGISITGTNPITTSGTATISASGFVSSALASGDIFVGNGSGTATAVAVTGDGTLSNAGSLSINSIGGKGVTLGGSLQTVGAFATTLTATGATSLTLPTSGTLLTNALTSADILVGNGSNVATAVAMSGDVAISNTGSTTVSSIGGKGVTLAGSLQTVGAFATTITVTAGTAITLPTSGTLLNNALNSGSIYVGSAGNVATGVAMSGDGAISNTGSLTISKIGGVAATLGGTLNTAGIFQTVGAFATTLTATGATALTLPTTGTLATTANINTALPTSTGGLLGDHAAGGATSITIGSDLSLSSDTLNIATTIASGHTLTGAWNWTTGSATIGASGSLSVAGTETVSGVLSVTGSETIGAAGTLSFTSGALITGTAEITGGSPVGPFTASGAGKTTISSFVGGTTTLSIAQYSNPIIQIAASTLTSNGTLVVPNTGQWTFENLLSPGSGPYTLTIKTAAGTGVIVPTGGLTNMTLGVIADGTNVQPLNASNVLVVTSSQTVYLPTGAVGVWIDGVGCGGPGAGGGNVVNTTGVGAGGGAGGGGARIPPTFFTAAEFGTSQSVTIGTAPDGWDRRCGVVERGGKRWDCGVGLDGGQPGSLRQRGRRAGRNDHRGCNRRRRRRRRRAKRLGGAAGSAGAGGAAEGVAGASGGSGVAAAATSIVGNGGGGGGTSTTGVAGAGGDTLTGGGGGGSGGGANAGASNNGAAGGVVFFPATETQGAGGTSGTPAGGTGTASSTYAPGPGAGGGYGNGASNGAGGNGGNGRLWRRRRRRRDRVGNWRGRQWREWRASYFRFVFVF